MGRPVAAFCFVPLTPPTRKQNIGVPSGQGKFGVQIFLCFAQHPLYIRSFWRFSRHDVGKKKLKNSVTA